MNEGSGTRFWLIILLLAALVGMGVFAYNLGMTQGMAVGVQPPAPAPSAAAAPVPYYPYYYGPFWFHPWGFGFLGCLFPILGLFLIFGLFRPLFFHRMGWWRGGGPRGNWPQDVPPQVEEWHRRMHEKSGDQPPASSTE